MFYSLKIFFCREKNDQTLTQFRSKEMRDFKTCHLICTQISEMFNTFEKKTQEQCISNEKLSLFSYFHGPSMMSNSTHIRFLKKCPPPIYVRFVRSFFFLNDIITQKPHVKFSIGHLVYVSFRHFGQIT